MNFNDDDNSIFMESFEEEAISIEDGATDFARRTNPFQILFWGMVSVFCVALIAFFVVFRGQMQENQFIAELENQGAEIELTINPPDWMRSTLRDYPISQDWFATIRGIKIDSLNITDDQFEQLAQSPMLRHATIKSDTMTRDALFAFGEAPRLQYLSLISCTKISRQDLEDFNKKHPNIVTSWRGNAFLGIRSYQRANYHQISSIMPDSPAERSGLKAHDRITAVDGNSVSSFNGLVEKLTQYNSGDVVQMSVLRGAEQLQIEVELGSWTNQI